jgi:subtilisin family serine protease
MARPHRRKAIVPHLDALESRNLPSVVGIGPQPLPTISGSIQVAGSPGDADINLQWGLSQANDVDINAPQAWSLAAGSSPTIVAVIDSGIDLTHPEFVDRLWTNPGEVPYNGLDDDGNGHVDDVHGWNFDVNTADIWDENGHGTHVAGIIAAAGNNGRGVVGVNPNARLMVLKTLDGSGGGTIDAAVRAVYYAVDHGARVINASWSGSFHSKALLRAVRYANQRGVVVVAASGNSSSNIDTSPEYPASYKVPNILSVAAINAAGRLAGFSNFGRRSVDIAAPGVGILSTVPGSYDSYSGTSMATPYVAGVVSLLVGQQPHLTARQIVQRVIATAKPLPGLGHRLASGGMVDASNVLSGQITSRRALRQSAILATPRTGTTLSAASLGMPTTDLATAVPVPLIPDNPSLMAFSRPNFRPPLQRPI